MFVSWKTDMQSNGTQHLALPLTLKHVVAFHACLTAAASTCPAAQQQNYQGIATNSGVSVQSQHATLSKWLHYLADFTIILLQVQHSSD